MQSIAPITDDSVTINATFLKKINVNLEYYSKVRRTSISPFDCTPAFKAALDFGPPPVAELFLSRPAIIISASSYHPKQCRAAKVCGVTGHVEFAQMA